MTFICLVVGNSRLHWAILDAERPVLLGAWDSRHLEPSDAADEWLPPALHPCTLYDDENAGVAALARRAAAARATRLVVASVVPAQTALWRARRADLREVGLSDCRLEGAYATLGVDRALALRGAGALAGLPALVVDAGTALTFTAAARGGELAGGAILPGIALQLEALASHTAALPRVAPPSAGAAPPARWARDTRDAIAGGVTRAALATVRDYARAWRAECAARGEEGEEGAAAAGERTRVFLTGGDAPLLHALLGATAGEAGGDDGLEWVFEPHVVNFGVWWCEQHDQGQQHEQGAPAAGRSTAAARPLLFLDVDGVLNTTTMAGGAALHPALLRRLAALVRETECEIVLSSSWRNEPTHRETLLAALDALGVARARFVDATPRLSPAAAAAALEGTSGPKAGGAALRAAEIALYAEARAATTLAPPRPWAVVDDLDLAGFAGAFAALPARFVRTSDETGLTEANCAALRQLLLARPDGGDGGAASAPRVADGDRVVLRGLVGSAALNGREGVVQGAPDPATGRVLVALEARGGEPARTLRVKCENASLAAAAAAPAPAPAPALPGGGAAAERPWRPTALSARPGPFKASYDWREVMPDGQAIPPGLEVLSSLEPGVPTVARIPAKWMLDVAVGGGRAPVRLEVGPRTTLGEVRAAVRARYSDLGGAAADGEGAPALFVDGRRCSADPKETVARAQLFGAKVRCGESQ